jgi:hypothetical protein
MVFQESKVGTAAIKLDVYVKCRDIFLPLEANQR